MTAPFAMYWRDVYFGSSVRHVVRRTLGDREYSYEIDDIAEELTALLRLRLPYDIDYDDATFTGPSRLTTERARTILEIQRAIAETFDQFPDICDKHRR